MRGGLILEKRDFTLGALYRLGLERGFGRQALVYLMMRRAGVSEQTAKQLAGHWLASYATQRKSA